MEADSYGLKAWRQRKGITLDTIAASTKLSIRQLEAIESGDFRKLPGGIYNTSYIRQYARAIDFDEDDILAYYHREQSREQTKGQTAAPEPRRPLGYIAG
jgi:cytoskeletal protein RodZ